MFAPPPHDIERERNGSDSPVATDRLSDAGGLRFKSHTGRVTGKAIKPSQVSGGIGTLQSRASGLQSITRGIPSRPEKPPSQKKWYREREGGNVYASMPNNQYS